MLEYFLQQYNLHNDHENCGVCSDMQANCLPMRQAVELLHASQSPLACVWSCSTMYTMHQQRRKQRKSGGSDQLFITMHVDK